MSAHTVKPYCDTRYARIIAAKAHTVVITKLWSNLTDYAAKPCSASPCWKIISSTLRICRRWAEIKIKKMLRAPQQQRALTILFWHVRHCTTFSVCLVYQVDEAGIHLFIWLNGLFFFCFSPSNNLLSLLPCFESGDSMNLFSRLKWLHGKIKKPAARSKKGCESVNGSQIGNTEVTTSKQSVSSTYHNGRRFQAYKDCSYVLPNDDTGKLVETHPPIYSQ